MTIACARCHDHKLDAISMRDYHGLLGILRSSRQVAHTIDAPDVNAEVIAKMHAKKAEIRASWRRIGSKEAWPLPASHCWRQQAKRRHAGRREGSR